MNLEEALDLQRRALRDLEFAYLLPQNRELKYHPFTLRETEVVSHDRVPYEDVLVVTKDGLSFGVQFTAGTHEDRVTYQISDAKQYEWERKSWGLPDDE